jgi:hypothetical protein
MRMVPGLVLAVMIAHAGARGQTLAEQRAQFIDCRFNGLRYYAHGWGLGRFIG